MRLGPSVCGGGTSGGGGGVSGGGAGGDYGSSWDDPQLPDSSIFVFIEKALRTDLRTDGPTDGRTDAPSYRDASNKALYIALIWSA